MFKVLLIIKYKCDKMMNKRKILILLVVLTIAIGFTIISVSSVEAAKIENIKISNSDNTQFYNGNGNT